MSWWEWLIALGIPFGVVLAIILAICVSAGEADKKLGYK